MLTEQKKLAIKRNLFPAICDIVDKNKTFPWHKDGEKDNSSQALAVNLFKTIESLKSCDQIVNAWARDMNLEMTGNWSIELEKLIPEDWLKEPRKTQIDAFAKCEKGIILFECKFTESDGGACSQTQKVRKGKNKGLIPCNGNYEDQINPVNKIASRCVLSGKNIQYWDHVPDVFNIDPLIDHRPCPFAKGWYQWMRNLVAAISFKQHCNKPAAFVVVYADGPFPMAQKVKKASWGELLQAISGRSVPMRTISYQRLLELAILAASSDDQNVIKELNEWMLKKIKTVSEKQ